MPESRLPRYLTAQQARTLRDELAEAVAGIRLRLIRDGADPACLEHEIGMELARAAARMNLDAYGVGDEARSLRTRIAELEASLEQAKVAAAPAPKISGSHVDPFAAAIARRTAAEFRDGAAMREATASAELAGAGVCRHPRESIVRGDEFNPDRCGVCHEILP